MRWDQYALIEREPANRYQGGHCQDKRWHFVIKSNCSKWHLIGHNFIVSSQLGQIPDTSSSNCGPTDLDYRLCLCLKCCDIRDTVRDIEMWSPWTPDTWHVTTVSPHCPMSSLPSPPWLHLLTLCCSLLLPTQTSSSRTSWSHLPVTLIQYWLAWGVCDGGCQCIQNWQQRGKLFYIPRIKIVIIEM